MEKKDIAELLELPLAELIGRADKVRKQFAGNRVELCNILNAKSGLCPEDCKFCAQSARHKTGAQAYPLKSKAEMLIAAKRAKEIGAERFDIVTSGDKLPAEDFSVIVDAIKEITEEVKIKTCASLGSLGDREFSLLKAAGLSRYHHNIESSPRFFAKIVSTHTFEDRLKTIKAAKRSGLEVCSGGIIGMGETMDDRIQMALILKELKVDSVPLNILVPIPGTPLGDNVMRQLTEEIPRVSLRANEVSEAIPTEIASSPAAPRNDSLVIPSFTDPLRDNAVLSCQEVIRTIAIFRIILKDKIIKIAAGRESIFKDFQALGFMAGANGMLIGGYLTIKGRSVEEDQKLVSQVEKLWQA